MTKTNIFKYLFFILSLFAIIFYFSHADKLPSEVSIITADGHKKINIETKNIYPNPEKTQIDFTKFSGLPKEYENSKTSLENRLFIKSEDQSKLIVRSTIFDRTIEPSVFDGSLTAISAQDYLCNVNNNQCIKSTLISSIELNNLIYWEKWDSKSNLLYGYLSGEGVGNASPVYIYNLNNNTYKKTIGYDSLKENEGEKIADIPSNFISPSLSKFIMVTNYGQPKLLLFNTNDLTKPTKEIALNLSDDGNGSTPDSIAWFKNEKEVILLNHKQIYLLNLDTEKLSLKYTDQIQGVSLLWLDFNHVFLTSNERYIIFVDYIQEDPSHPGQLNQVLKAIDLNKNNAVLDVLGNNEFLSLDY